MLQDLTNSIKDTTFFNYSNGNMLPSFYVEIPQGDAEQIKENWIKLLEKGNDTKSTSSSTLVSIDRFLIKKISTDTAKVVSEIFCHHEWCTYGCGFFIRMENGQRPMKILIRKEALKIWFAKFVNDELLFNSRSRIEARRKD